VTQPTSAVHQKTSPGAIVEDDSCVIERPDEIAAGGVEHALGLAGRARRVEDEQRVFGAHRLRRAVVGDGATTSLVHTDGRGLSTMATWPPVRWTTMTDLTVDWSPRRSSASSTLALSGIGLAAAQAFVGGDHARSSRNRRCGRRSASGEKPPNTTEWIAPMRAQASIAIGRLGDHRHVDGDPVALGDALALQHVGEAADFGVEFAVGDPGRDGWIIAYEDDGDVVGLVGQVAVECSWRRR